MYLSPADQLRVAAVVDHEALQRAWGRVVECVQAIVRWARQAIAQFAEVVRRCWPVVRPIVEARRAGLRRMHVAYSRRRGRR